MVPTCHHPDRALSRARKRVAKLRAACSVGEGQVIPLSSDVMFHEDNTDGYTKADLEPGSDEYYRAAKAFADEVARRWLAPSGGCAGASQSRGDPARRATRQGSDVAAPGAPSYRT